MSGKKRDDSFELGVKRFYMPGVVVKDKCVKCGGEASLDLGDQYLSYPTVNASNDVDLWCSACDDQTTTVQRWLHISLTDGKS
jgi:hypothetical protein